MTARLIPTAPSVPSQSLKLALEGRTFVLHLAWNQRESRWYLSIHDEEDHPIQSGLKLNVNWPLLQTHRYNVGLPPGEFICTDLTQSGAPAGLDELGPGLRCELTYFESTA